MQEMDKQTIFTSLKKCEALVQANLKTVGEVHEAETRSINNEKLAAELLTFGTFVADVQHMAQTEKDHVEQMFEHMKLELINGTTSDGERDGIVSLSKAPMTVSKAESTVKTDLSYIAALSNLRDIQKSLEVLKRKERSLNAILDQSRSRLSLVSKGIPT